MEIINKCETVDINQERLDRLKIIDIFIKHQQIINNKWK